MSVLHLKQNVVVKVIVTDQFKQDFKKELERQLASAEEKAKEYKSSLARLVIESSGMGNTSYVESLKAKIEEERMLQEALASELKERLKEVDSLTIDSIFPYTVLEGFVDVNEGDNLLRKVSSQEVVIKDGIVVSIKED
ncbi:MAG: YlqD family protein [Caldisericaceae bacterium]